MTDLQLSLGLLHYTTSSTDGTAKKADDMGAITQGEPTEEKPPGKTEGRKWAHWVTFENTSISKSHIFMEIFSTMAFLSTNWGKIIHRDVVTIHLSCQLPL